MDLASSFPAPGDALPFVREGGEQRSGPAHLIAIVEVVNVVIVEVHGFLYQAQTQREGVKIDVALGVIHGSGNVMESFNACGHGVPS
jgi:hypothetical protein